MNTLFLTTAELNELTGFKAAHCQVRWLQANRWRFALTKRKEPRVAREHFKERMGCGGGSTSRSDVLHAAATVEQPNFAALDRR